MAVREATHPISVVDVEILIMKHSDISKNTVRSRGRDY